MKSTTTEIIFGSLLAAALVVGAFAAGIALYCVAPALIALILALFLDVSFWACFGAMLALRMIAGFFTK